MRLRCLSVVALALVDAVALAPVVHPHANLYTSSPLPGSTVGGELSSVITAFDQQLKKIDDAYLLGVDGNASGAARPTNNDLANNDLANNHNAHDKINRHERFKHYDYNPRCPGSDRKSGWKKASFHRILFCSWRWYRCVASGHRSSTSNGGAAPKRFQEELEPTH